MRPNDSFVWEKRPHFVIIYWKYGSPDMNDINEKHVRTSNIVKIPGVMRHIWMYVFVFHRKNENHTGLDQHEGEEIVFGELLLQNFLQFLGHKFGFT